jgi:iron complex transport system permease protein
MKFTFLRSLTAWAIPLLIVLVIACGLASLASGSASLSVKEVIGILLGQLGFGDLNSDSIARAIVIDIRLPRILLGGMVGAALAISGAAMQALFRNPLADPGLIGISGGAALAAAIVIVLISRWAPYSVMALGPWAPALAAFAGGLVVTLLVYRIGCRGGALSVSTMLLAGIALNALTGAGTGLMTYIAPDQQLRTILFWSLGTLGNTNWQAVILFSGFFVIGSAMLLRKSRDLNTLLLGEQDAASLGVDLARVKRHIIVATALLVGSSVALCGVIAFVGLVVPHMIRISIGPDNRRLLPCAALLGAALLMCADLLARTVLAPGELPIGIITALVGGPFFLYLLIRNRGKYAI